jgi:hypothetical protein
MEHEEQQPRTNLMLLLNEYKGSCLPLLEGMVDSLLALAVMTPNDLLGVLGGADDGTRHC